MAHFNFVISQNAKWGHAGFYIDCHRMTVPENILLQKSTAQFYSWNEDFLNAKIVILFERQEWLWRRSLLRISPSTKKIEHKNERCPCWANKCMHAATGFRVRIVGKKFTPKVRRSTISNNYSATDRGEEYCDERVCLCVFVCPRSSLRNYTSDLYQFLCMLPGRVSVLLWRRSDMLRISAFMDDVMFAHKLRLLDVTARLRQWGSHAAWAWRTWIPVAGSGLSGLLLADRAYWYFWDHVCT